MSFTIKLFPLELCPWTLPLNNSNDEYCLLLLLIRHAPIPLVTLHDNSKS